MATHGGTSYIAKYSWEDEAVADVLIHMKLHQEREVPLERWDVEAGYNPSLVPQGMTIYVRFGAFCSGKHHAESEDGRKGGGGQAEDRVDSRRLPLSALRACSDGLAKLAGK